ncbi:MAG: fatty acid desaturase [Terrimicrobiaceae bacterium]|nr:fatty acid desaturase [Terrimicrobiaceae bacterium]
MKYFRQEIRWLNSAFLIGTFVTTITAVPFYIWKFGLDGFQIGLFLFFFIATGLSITLGYHRLFSHLTFQATWPVKLFTLLFGAAAFEGSALGWCADHRRHHKFVDHDDDPYDISKGFFHAHIGWLLFRTGPDTPLTWVRDLQKDRLAWWQHEYYVPIALVMGFVVPAALGLIWGGPVAALGGFLIAGVARVVFVHHMTFCINSLCHWIGDRPYSSHCTARDSLLMAFFTFGEGYHNFHHEFQHDYRNGVRPWQFDPTKWTIWLLARLGLVSRLRTVPEEKILKARIAEQERRIREKLAHRPASDPVHAALEAGRQRVHEAVAQWESLLASYREAQAARHEGARDERRTLKRRLREASDELRKSIRQWMASCHLAGDELAA